MTPGFTVLFLCYSGITILATKCIKNSNKTYKLYCYKMTSGFITFLLRKSNRAYFIIVHKNPEYNISHKKFSLPNSSVKYYFMLLRKGIVTAVLILISNITTITHFWTPSWTFHETILTRMQDNTFPVKVPKVYENFYLMSTPLGSPLWQCSQK